MVDKVQNQSIDFVGEIRKQEEDTKFQIMDYPTQVAFAEMNKNYNKMVNNMFKVCASLCIQNFNYPKLSQKEMSCVENCQKKFYATYVSGQSFVNNVIEETKKTDIFSDKNEVDIIESTRQRKV